MSVIEKKNCINRKNVRNRLLSYYLKLEKVEVLQTLFIEIENVWHKKNVVAYGPGRFC